MELLGRAPRLQDRLGNLLGKGGRYELNKIEVDMNKKAMRYSFNKVISIADKARCHDLDHKAGQHHEFNEMCPVEYEMQKHIQALKQHMKEIGL